METVQDYEEKYGPLELKEAKRCLRCGSAKTFTIYCTSCQQVVNAKH